MSPELNISDALKEDKGERKKSTRERREWTDFKKYNKKKSFAVVSITWCWLRNRLNKCLSFTIKPYYWPIKLYNWTLSNPAASKCMPPGMVLYNFASQECHTLKYLLFQKWQRKITRRNHLRTKPRIYTIVKKAFLLQSKTKSLIKDFTQLPGQSSPVQKDFIITMDQWLWSTCSFSKEAVIMIILFLLTIIQWVEQKKER